MPSAAVSGLRWFLHVTLPKSEVKMCYRASQDQFAPDVGLGSQLVSDVHPMLAGNHRHRLEQTKKRLTSKAAQMHERFTCWVAATRHTKAAELMHAITCC